MIDYSATRDAIIKFYRFYAARSLQVCSQHTAASIIHAIGMLGAHTKACSSYRYALVVQIAFCATSSSEALAQYSGCIASQQVPTSRFKLVVMMLLACVQSNSLQANASCNGTLQLNSNTCVPVAVYYSSWSE